MIKKTSNEMWKKTGAIAVSILIISVTFSISLSLSSPQAKAAESQTGCCIKTKTGQSCVNGATSDICDNPAINFKTSLTGDCSNVAECKPGVCVPLDKGSACMSNIEKTPCETNYVAKWFSGDISSRAECQKGCCIIAEGVKAEVVQQRQCEELTKDLGYAADNMKFDTSITRQIDCAKAGSPKDLSCCVLSGGSCKYETRDACTSENGNFMEGGGMAGVLCSVVDACTSAGHAKTGCGTLPGTEMNVYWFDSQGNQEDIKESCNYPENICSKKNETSAECISTRCKIEGALGSQNISGGLPAKVVDSNGKTLLTGTSMCYNFYTGYQEEASPVVAYSTGGMGVEVYMPGEKSSLELYEKSTGLQNEILHCNLGKIQIDTLGPDRGAVCIQSTVGSLHGKRHVQDSSKCSTCGSDKRVLDFFGDLFGPFPPLGVALNEIFSNFCTRDECDELGDCVYLEDAKGIWGFATDIGSCSPKYPAGTNILAGTPGNYKFDTSASKGNCSQCGKGGDAMWNTCDSKECASLGDCEFGGYVGLEAFARGALLFTMMTSINRIEWIPVECLTAGWFMIPYGPAGVGACFSERGAIYFAAPAPVTAILTAIKTPLLQIAAIGGSIGVVLGIAQIFKK